MNEYNPNGKDIRFIDSHYHDLFHLPDGGHIQIDYGNESVLKRCTFIDEYHTQIGFNVFHICQFAELMERNGNHYCAEPETETAQAAWKVGRGNYLEVELYGDGFDYYLYDDEFRQIADGYLDTPELSMSEARNQILEKHGFENRDLVNLDFDFLRENVQQVMQREMAENRRSVTIEQLADELVSFAADFDPYEWMDQGEDFAKETDAVQKELRAGNIEVYREFLTEVITESRDSEAVENAQALMGKISSLESGMANSYRYYITPEALQKGVYPYMDGYGKEHQTNKLRTYEGDLVKAFGYLEFPAPLSDQQLKEYFLVPSRRNPDVIQNESKEKKKSVREQLSRTPKQTPEGKRTRKEHKNQER